MVVVTKVVVGVSFPKVLVVVRRPVFKKMELAGGLISLVPRPKSPIKRSVFILSNTNL